MYKIVSVFILLFALNCKSTENPSKMNQKEMVLISKGSLYGAGEEGIRQQNLVISDNQDWNDLLEKMNSVNEVSKNFEEKNIDFETYKVIAVFDEVKSTGGHSITLDISNTQNETLVQITKKAPDGMATTVMSQPYCIVKIPKNDLPVVFE